jgi:hypothetical protein
VKTEEGCSGVSLLQLGWALLSLNSGVNDFAGLFSCAGLSVHSVVRRVALLSDSIRIPCVRPRRWNAAIPASTNAQARFLDGVGRLPVERGVCSTQAWRWNSNTLNLSGWICTGRHIALTYHRSRGDSIASPVKASIPSFFIFL